MRRRFELLTGAVFVLTAIWLNLKLMGPVVMVLNLGLVIAFFVWSFRFHDKNQARNRIVSIYLIAIAVQCMHVCEEYLMNFHIKLPELLGYDEWSGKLFVAFNLIWLFVFVLAAYGLLHNVRLAYLVVWFFAIVGGIGNGIFHPVLSIIEGGYFPGLITSAAHLVVGIVLIKELGSSSKVRADEHA